MSFMRLVLFKFDARVCGFVEEVVDSNQQVLLNCHNVSFTILGNVDSLRGSQVIIEFDSCQIEV